MVSLNLRALHIRAIGALLALHRSLTLFQARGSLPHHIWLALDSLAVLMRLFARRLRLLTR